MSFPQCNRPQLEAAKRSDWEGVSCRTSVVPTREHDHIPMAARGLEWWRGFTLGCSRMPPSFPPRLPFVTQSVPNPVPPCTGVNVSAKCAGCSNECAAAAAAARGCNQGECVGAAGTDGMLISYALVGAWCAQFVEGVVRSCLIERGDFLLLHGVTRRHSVGEDFKESLGNASVCVREE